MDTEEGIGVARRSLIGIIKDLERLHKIDGRGVPESWIRKHFDEWWESEKIYRLYYQEAFHQAVVAGEVVEASANHWVVAD